MQNSTGTIAGMVLIGVAIMVLIMVGDWVKDKYAIHKERKQLAKIRNNDTQILNFVREARRDFS